MSMLVALRWERTGGILTMGSGVGLGGFMALYLYTLAPAELRPIGMFLIGTLWMLPFVIFGLLFYKLGRRDADLRHNVTC